MNRKTILGDPPPIRITSRDLGRIDGLLGSAAGQVNSPILEFLQGELDRARLVEESEVATPFVRIGSRVLFSDDAGKTYRLTLSLPGDPSDESGSISILTPVGAALLGLSEGQSIAYETRDGRTKTITVLEVSESEPPTS